MGKLTKEQGILAEFMLSHGLKYMEPKELMDICMIVLCFTAIAFRKEHLTRLEVLNVLEQRLNDHFNWAFDQAGPQAAHEEVLKQILDNLE